MALPSKHTLAGLNFLILLPLVYHIPPWVKATITVEPLWVTIISVGIIFSLLSYIAMPLFLMGYRNLMID